MSYERISDISRDLVESASSLPYVRKMIFDKLEPPKNNVILLKGARGIGKSTLIKQYLADKQDIGEPVLYVSADSALLDTSLAELAYEYNKRGGVFLAIDEIHKSQDWQTQVKTILDSFESIKLIASGSSSLSLDYSSADLSRRHVMIHAKGLSFREYVRKEHDINLPILSMGDIIDGYMDLSNTIAKKFQTSKIDLLRTFKEYLKNGYFISRENYTTNELYYNSLSNSISSIIDSDIPSVHSDIDNVGRSNMKLLSKHITGKCPFMPNISELSRSLNIANDSSLKKYLHYLDEGEVLTNLYTRNKSHKDFQKPQKIYINNTNYVYSFNAEPDIGSLRETYVANCLRGLGPLTAPKVGDFCLDGELVFEVGGRNKDLRQIQDIKNSYVLADDIFVPEERKIPMWILGFLW